MQDLKSRLKPTTFESNPKTQNISFKFSKISYIINNNGYTAEQVYLHTGSVNTSPFSPSEKLIWQDVLCYSKRLIVHTKDSYVRKYIASGLFKLLTIVRHKHNIDK